MEGWSLEHHQSSSDRQESVRHGATPVAGNLFVLTRSHTNHGYDRNAWPWIDYLVHRKFAKVVKKYDMHLQSDSVHTG